MFIVFVLVSIIIFVLVFITLLIVTLPHLVISDLVFRLNTTFRPYMIRLKDTNKSVDFLVDCI
jgi:hypothetical protein